MRKDKIEELFHQLQGEFDLEDAPAQHQQRFLMKLQQSSGEKLTKQKRGFNFKPWIGIAAGFAILLSVVLGLKMNNQPTGLAAVSPEMAQTQNFYTGVINRELRKISKRETPETKLLIQDAMTQMKKLELDFAALRKDLIVSGDDSRVIYAMIANFQSRISILKKVLEQIENVEQIKQKSHENPTTI